MIKKTGKQSTDKIQKELQQKRGIVDAIKTIQEFEKILIKPKEERKTNFSRYSKGMWESPRYFSQI